MNFNLDAAMASFDPWDLTLTIDGQTYKTLPLTLADRQRLATASTAGELREIVAGRFAGDPKPNVESWDDEKLSGVINALVAYRETLAKKNAERVGTMVGEAARLSPPGRSS
jgi:hypothetical protein